jgi:hypothetical protein
VASLQGNGPAGAAGSEAVLAAITAELARNPRLTVQRGREADIEISALLTDSKWLIGKKKVTFEACLSADAVTKTVNYWEMVKESGAGLPPLFRFKVTTYKTDSKTISGKVEEQGFGPGGNVLDYEWDYGQVRRAVEQVAATCGWQFATTLLKGKAQKR